MVAYEEAFISCSGKAETAEEQAQHLILRVAELQKRLFIKLSWVGSAEVKELDRKQRTLMHKAAATTENPEFLGPLNDRIKAQRNIFAEMASQFLDCSQIENCQCFS